MRSSMKFEGGRDLETALASLKKSTAKGVVRRALRQALAPLVDMAKGLAPKDEGRLDQALEVQNWKRKLPSTEVKIIFGIKAVRDYRERKRKRSKKNYPYQIGSTPEVYGMLAEIGTSRQRATPFMRPAWSKEGGQPLLERVGKLVWAEIEKTRVRAARRAAARARRMGQR